MVDAGIARKVDFGEGRFRFEHSYRHPRHFHLICKTCNRSFEFLSSDIEALIEEVAPARNFTPRQSVLQIHGTCEACRTGRPAAAEGGTTELLFARDALRIAIATERSGLEFYSRGAAGSRGTRAAGACSRSWPRRRRNISARSRRATASCCSRIRSSSRGRRSCFSRARPTGSSPPAPSSSTKGVNDRQALMIGIKCERGSHRFFKRYGERFEDSEGKRIFLEFADEERDAPRAADPRVPRARRAAAARRASRRAKTAPARDRPDPIVIDLHLHTTASDGRLAPAALVARAAAPDCTIISRHRSRHGRGTCRSRAAAARARACGSSTASRSPRSNAAATCTCSAISSIPANAALAQFLDAAARPRGRARARDRRSAARRSASPSTSAR